MSEETSKCYEMQSVVAEYQAWKADLHRFLSKYDSLHPELRYQDSISKMIDVVDAIVRLKKASDVNGHDGVISDANRLISHINSGKINRGSAMGVLKSGLTRLEKAMDDIIHSAQIKNDCQLEGGPTPNAGAAAATGSATK